MNRSVAPVVGPAKLRQSAKAKRPRERSVSTRPSSSSRRALREDYDSRVEEIYSRAKELSISLRETCSGPNNAKEKDEQASILGEIQAINKAIERKKASPMAKQLRRSRSANPSAAKARDGVGVGSRDRYKDKENRGARTERSTKAAAATEEKKKPKAAPSQGPKIYERSQSWSKSLYHQHDHPR